MIGSLWTEHAFGNLYDFYRKVFLKLAEGVKVPFELDGDRRLDESPIHVALREALCNALVHADYSDRIAVLVVKSPAMFEFRNPGMMRIPVELALHGAMQIAVTACFIRCFVMWGLVINRVLEFQKFSPAGTDTIGVLQSCLIAGILVIKP